MGLGGSIYAERRIIVCFTDLCAGVHQLSPRTVWPGGEKRGDLPGSERGDGQPLWYLV